MEQTNGEMPDIGFIYLLCTRNNPPDKKHEIQCFYISQDKTGTLSSGYILPIDKLCTLPFCTSHFCQWHFQAPFTIFNLNRGTFLMQFP